LVSLPIVFISSDYRETWKLEKKWKLEINQSRALLIPVFDLNKN